MSEQRLDKSPRALPEKADFSCVVPCIDGRHKEVRSALDCSGVADFEVSKIVREVLNIIGTSGIVIIERSGGNQTEVQYVEGLKINQGYVSSDSAVGLKNKEMILKDPLVVITDSMLSTGLQIQTILEKAGEMSKNMVLIAEHFSREALAALSANNIERHFRCLAVKAPAFGDRRKAILEDIAILTGGRVANVVDSIPTPACPECFGQARCVVAGSQDTFIIGGGGFPETIQARKEQIKAQLGLVRSEYEKEKVQQRLSNLVKVAVIRVNSRTESGFKEKKSRIISAFAGIKSSGNAAREGVCPKILFRY